MIEFYLGYLAMWAGLCAITVVVMVACGFALSVVTSYLNGHIVNFYQRTLLAVYRLESVRHFMGVMVKHGRAGLLAKTEEAKIESENVDQNDDQ